MMRYKFWNQGHTPRRFGFSWMVIAAGLILSGKVNAVQDACPMIVRTEAVAGEPFGVGMVSFRLPEQRLKNADPNMIIRTGAVQVSEQNHRIFYAAEGRPPAARFFRTVFGKAEVPTDELISIWFLFRGDQPLSLSVWGCEGITVKVEPENVRDKRHQRLLKQWWREYQTSNLSDQSDGDFPDLVPEYLCEMLASRFGLDRPHIRPPSNDPLLKTIELLTDVDPLSSRMIHDWFGGITSFENAELDLPPTIPWTPVVAKNLPEVVPIEPIAYHVPQDCFYLRFGTWDNQIWLKRLLQEHGGDLTRMIRLRGFKAKVQSKFLNQLALESSQIDEWFGGNLIADVAVIGRDTYFDTGASIGVVLQSKDTDALKARIQKRREKFAEEHPQQVSINNVEIDGHTVSILSSPDNRYRSFHVVSGDTHLFTNSHQIAKSFLNCPENKSSLGDSAEFRYLRTQLPLHRDDTIFIYLSTAFFQKILEPAYQIELFRRGQAITEMQVLQLAGMASANEGFPNAPMEFLIGNRFLPESFSKRPQGSQIEVVSGQWQDRKRGQRGFFIPIADETIEKVTRSEYAWYAERAQFFSDNVRQLDPLVVALQRFQKEDQIERIFFDARIAPFGQEKYGWLTSMLGQPMEFEVRGNEDDLIRLQVSLKGGVWQRNVPPHQLFASVQGDVSPQADLTPESFLDSWKALKQIPGYLGAFPKPGTLDWMPRLGGEPDENGFTYSRLLDLWRLQFGDFSVLAFDRQRLEGLVGKLKVVRSERPAQVRLSVGDLSKSDLDGWASVINYRRAWETSIANTELLNLIVEQFGVPAESALTTVETLLDVKLVCSLGGEYQLVELPGRKIWASNAWPDFSQPQLPSEYTAPVLNWFRGLEVEVTQVQNQYSMHGHFDIERTPNSGPTLPSFDLFNGFQKLFPGGKPDEKE